MTLTRRQTIVEAMRVTDDNQDEVAKWCHGSIKGYRLPECEREIEFFARDREHRAAVGDWIVLDCGQFSVLTDAERHKFFLE